MDANAAVASDTREWHAVAVGGASLAVGVFSIWTSPLLVSYLADQARMGAEVAGLLVTIQLLALVVASMLAARTIDRLDKRVLAIAGTVVCLLGLALLLTLSHPFMIASALVVVGAGQGLAFAAASGIAAVSNNPDRAYGQMTVVGGIYGALWLFLAPRLTHVAPDVVSLFLVANILCLPVVTLSLDRVAISGACPPGPARFPLNAVSVAFLAAIVLLFCAAGSLWAFADQIGLGLGLSQTARGNVLAATTVSGFIGSGAAAVIGSRFGRIMPIALGYAVTSSCFLAACLARSPNLFIAMLVIQSAAQMYLVPVQFGMGAALDSRGRLAVAAGSMLLLGNAIGPAFAGLIVGAGTIALLGWSIFAMTATSAVLLAWVADRQRCPRVIVSMGDGHGHGAPRNQA